VLKYWQIQVAERGISKMPIALASLDWWAHQNTQIGQDWNFAPTGASSSV
jgi:hypothetical protein